MVIRFAGFAALVAVLAVTAPSIPAAPGAPGRAIKAAPLTVSQGATTGGTKAPQPAQETTQWGLLSKLVGTDYTVYKGTENAATMRFVWQVPGQSIRIQLLRAGAWVDDDLIERTDDPKVFRQIQKDGAVGSARSLADGRIVWKYPTGNTAAWRLSGGRLAIGQMTNGYKWFSYYFAENPEGQAALAAAGPEAYKLPYQDELAAATEQENIERANSAAQDAEIEAEAAAKRSAWNATAAQNEQAFADSLQNLNNTVSNIQAQQRDAERMRHEAQQSAANPHRQADAENVRRATQQQEAIARQNGARPTVERNAGTSLGTTGDKTSNSCTVAQKTVIPSGGSGDTREAAEADVRLKSDRACGSSGVSDYGLTNACTQQVGIHGNRYWLCTPRVQCNATEKKCANTPSQGSAQ